MIALPLPDCDTAALHLALRARGVEIPCYRWRDICLARVSVQGYTSSDDGDRLVTALRAEIAG
jgi:isopenicillin-N epimerase